MNLLLDSHVVVWALGDPGRLSARSREAITDTESALFLSAASVWELGLKASKGKLVLPGDWLDAAFRLGVAEVPVRAADAVAACALPWHHTDPFDRLLVAQAARHGFALVSRDRELAAYGVKLLVA